jgi:predicted nucleotidyltransferase
MTDPSNDIITRFVGELVERLLSCIGENRVRSIFVGGSVADGEHTYSTAGGVVEVYSDVDLYVVVDDAVELEEARRGARACAAEVPLEGPGYRFHRGPDVGVYTFEVLSAQPARPGTVALEWRHRVVYGDADVPARAAERIGTRIEAGEALYLLENRLYELAALEQEMRSSADGARRGYHAFAVCKTGLDAATASLIVRGEYEARRSERLRKLDSLALKVRDDERWSSESLELVRRCGRRLEAMPSPDWTNDIDAAAEAEGVVELVLDRWKLIAATLSSGDPNDWSDLVLRRCHTGDYLGNFRQFRAINARCGFKRHGAIPAGVHLSRYSPVDALRLTGLMDYLSRLSPLRPDVGRLVATLGSYLDRLTRECGFAKGSLIERAYEMFRAVQ